MSRDSTPGFSAGASAPGGAPTLNDHGHRPADNNRVPPGGGRRSFANPSPAEIVVRNRQISLTPRNGISLCELLRNDRATRSVPIVVLTADGRPQVCQSAYRAGATRVLAKPCLPHDLWRELEQLCTHQ